jgi:hypothetical protein
MGIRLPALYSAATFLINDARLDLLAPLSPDKYFLGTLDFLSLGTLRFFNFFTLNSWS